MEDIWKELLLLFGTNGITGWTSWFFGRRKSNAETDSTIIDNLQQSLAFYKDICDDNQRRLDENQKRLDEMQRQLDEKQRQLDEKQKQLNDALRQNIELQEEIIKLRSSENAKITELHRKIGELQGEIIESRQRQINGLRDSQG